MKIIIDTNVIISAVLKGRIPKQVIQFIIDSSDYDWLVSLEILSEYREVLSRPKFRLSEVIIKEWFDVFETATRLVKVDLSVDFARDKKDAKFLACAMVSKADFLITGDRDFEEVKDLGYTRIIMVSEFKALFIDARFF